MILYDTCNASQNFVQLLESSQSILKTGLVTAPALVKPTDIHLVPVRVLNPTAAPIQLYKHSKIAIGTRITEAQTTPIDGEMTPVHLVESTTNCKITHSTEERIKTKFADLDLSDSALEPADKERLTALLNEYEDVFSDNEHDLGTARGVTHSINTGDARPIRQKLYRSAFSLRDVISSKIKDMLENKIIEPSTSEWASPVVLVKKNDGT